MKKTNVMRLLDAAGIKYSVSEYEVDENDLSGGTVASKIQADPDAVFKTLVTRAQDNRVLIFCIPVTTELDRKKAAAAAGVRSIDLISVRELFDITGYIRGGCSPLGMKKNYPLYVDESVLLFERVYVSAGVRGAQIALSPEALVALGKAVLADVI